MQKLRIRLRLNMAIWYYWLTLTSSTRLEAKMKALLAALIIKKTLNSNSHSLSNEVKIMTPSILVENLLRL
jgi:hypothetical protein